MLLLLGVLERREEVRVRRLGVREGGMGALLAELGWVFLRFGVFMRGSNCDDDSTGNDLLLLCASLRR